MVYKISRKASEDIESIWLYTVENWSADQADRYVNLILDEIEYIAGVPTTGKRFDHIRKGYYCTKVKSHLIFYRIVPKQQTIEIIRVLHERMDIDNHLMDQGIA